MDIDYRATPLRGSSGLHAGGQERLSANVALAWPDADVPAHV